MWFQRFFMFIPIWGRWTQFDEHIFQRGWFNHQPESHQLQMEWHWGTTKSRVKYPQESHWTFSRPFTWFISPDSKTARGPPAHVSRQLMATLPSSHPNFGSEFSKGIRAPKWPKHSGSGFVQYIAQMYGWFCSWWILFIGFLRERGSELGLRNIS